MQFCCESVSCFFSSHTFYCPCKQNNPEDQSETMPFNLESAHRTDLIDQALDLMFGDLDSGFSPANDGEDELCPVIMNEEVEEFLKLARERRMRRTGKLSYDDSLDTDSLEGVPVRLQGREWLEDDGSEFSEGEDYELPLNDCSSELPTCDHRSPIRSMDNSIESTSLTSLIRAAM
jgi:hypothetical protein